MMIKSQANLASPPDVRHHSLDPFDRSHVFAEVRVLAVQKVPFSSSIYECESLDSALGNKLAKNGSFFWV